VAPGRHERASPDRVAGVDGCRRGWVVAVATVEPFAVESVTVAATIRPVVTDPTLSTVAIDMPVGLLDDGPRDCDRACRALLGPRRSSVFPTPARSVLDATDFDDALRRQRRATGTGLSLQSWYLVPKIAELDAALGRLGRLRGDRVVETHPELAFTTLAGAPMRHAKRTPAGRRERLLTLHRHVERRWTRPAAIPTGAAGDDVLDAIALAVRAAQWAAGSPVVELGGDRRDAAGRLVRIRG
jgi:predicted RNase H-like nuclease